MRKIKQYGQNVHISKDLIHKLSKDERLNKIDYRLIVYLLTELNDVDFIHIRQKKISEELSLSESVVSKMFSHLKSLGILEVGTTSGLQKGYRIRIE